MNKTDFDKYTTLAIVILIAFALFAFFSLSFFKVVVFSVLAAILYCLNYIVQQTNLIRK